MEKKNKLEEIKKFKKHILSAGISLMSIYGVYKGINKYNQDKNSYESESESDSDSDSDSESESENERNKLEEITQIKENKNGKKINKKKNNSKKH